MYSDCDTPKGGLPHSDIHGSTPARGSPWLFAACHVFHRLLVPRHPPNALIALEINGFWIAPKANPPCAGTIHSQTVRECIFLAHSWHFIHSAQFSSLKRSRHPLLEHPLSRNGRSDIPACSRCHHNTKSPVSSPTDRLASVIGKARDGTSRDVPEPDSQFKEQMFPIES